MVHEEVEIDPVSAEDLHGLAVVPAVQELLHDVDDQRPRVDHLQVATRHLQNRSKIMIIIINAFFLSLLEPDRTFQFLSYGQRILCA